MNILCLGDIVGRPGREALDKQLKALKKEYDIDFTVINGENSAGGSGITSRIANHFFRIGCDVITLGDHTWDQREVISYLNKEKRILRPANYSDDTPGRGYCIQELGNGLQVGVINLMGRVFMKYPLPCPFRTLEKIVQEIRLKTNIITDLGMSGPYDSVIGQNKEKIIERFLTSRPVQFEVASKDARLSGIVVDVDEETGKAISIQRIQRKVELD